MFNSFLEKSFDKSEFDSFKNHKIGGLSFEDQKIRDQIADKYWNTIVKHWERVAV